MQIPPSNKSHITQPVTAKTARAESFKREKVVGTFLEAEQWAEETTERLRCDEKVHYRAFQDETPRESEFSPING